MSELSTLPDGRDPETGRLMPGHSVAPRNRWRPGQVTEAEAIRKHLEPSKLKVLDKLTELAKAGDPRSIEVYLRYFSPGARQEDEKVQVPGLAEAPTMEAKAQAVIAAVAAGQISTAAGATALTLLDRYTKLILAADFDARLKALEQGRAGPKPSTPAGDIVDVPATPSSADDPIA